MKLTSQQEKIFVNHIALLKKDINSSCSEYTLHCLDTAYTLYRQLQNQDIPIYTCNISDLWLELARIPVTDVTINKIEELMRRLESEQYLYGHKDSIMQAIISLQLALGIEINAKYYSIFLDLFDDLYSEVVSDDYRVCYQKQADKTKKMETPNY